MTLLESDATTDRRSSLELRPEWQSAGCQMKVHMVAVLLLLLTYPTMSSGQVLSVDSNLSVSGLVEAYYVFDVDQPASNNRPSFLYNHTRTNEVAINLAFVKVHYAENSVRAGLALMTGTYPEANLAAEPSLWRNVFEANVGVHLSTTENLWLDAGIYPSHIGFETAVTKDNWTLTRSILADNSPYYESGARVTYVTRNNAWTFCAHVLNGWQQIQRPAGYSALSFGWQVVYQPNSDITLNSSAFIGNTKPDSAKQFRYFHNFYGIFALSPSLGLTAGFDIGAQQKSVGSSAYSLWYSPVVILRYRVNESIYVAGRVEYYDDRDGVIVSTGTPNGFMLVGSSLNVDYSVTKGSLLRIEGRLLRSKDKTFMNSGEAEQASASIATSFSVFF